MNRILIYGSGNRFILKQKSILNNYCVQGIVDNFKEGNIVLDNGELVPIIRPERCEATDIIIVTISRFWEAWKQLREYGIKENNIIFPYQIEPLCEEEKELFSNSEKIVFENGNICYLDRWGRKFQLNSQEDMDIIKQQQERILVDSKVITDLCSCVPLNRDFGISRGKPVDRYYIETFLWKYKELIHGDVLEIGGNEYTQKMGADNVLCSYVLDVNPSKSDYIKGNLETGEGIEGLSFDCIVLTQVLPFIYDCRKVVHNIYKMLKDGGAALITVGGLEQISRYDMDRWGHYWSFTTLSLQRLLEEVVSKENIIIECYGNVKAATALLYGVATEELTQEDLDACDEDYQVTICAIMRKSSSIN